MCSLVGPRFFVRVFAVGATVALGGCAATATPSAPAVTVASSAAVSAQPIPESSSNAPWATASPAPAAAPGALVFDQAPMDAAEVYEDDAPIAVDAGEPVPTPAGAHKIELVMKGLVVWSAKVRVPEGGTVHVRIPAKYATAYAE